MKKELLEGLTEEQIAKARECKSQEELLKVAKEEGVELNDEQLAAVSGGGCFTPDTCPKCGRQGVSKAGSEMRDGELKTIYQCNHCHFAWIPEDLG